MSSRYQSLSQFESVVLYVNDVMYSDSQVIFVQLFVANKNKPSDIVSILVTNRNKLLRLFSDFKTDKGE